MGWRQITSSLVGVRTDRDPVPVILPEPLRGQVVQYLRDGDEVTAVRLVRRRTGLDLPSAVPCVPRVPSVPPGTIGPEAGRRLGRGVVDGVLSPSAGGACGPR